MKEFSKDEVYDALNKATSFLNENRIPYCPLHFHETIDDVPIDNKNRVTSGMFRPEPLGVHICLEAIERETKTEGLLDVMHGLFHEYGVQLTYINYGLWALFHELGHYYHKKILHKDYNTPEMFDAVMRVETDTLLYGVNSYEAQYAYRLIPAERDADSFAFKMLKKFLSRRRGRR